MVGVEGPVTMHSSNSGARAANVADSRQRRGPANRRRSVHPGGGPPTRGWAKAPPRQKSEKFGLKKINQKYFLYFFIFFFSSDIFFHHFSWRVGNTSGFGMQLGFCMWLDRYGGVWVQLARGARCDIEAFYTALPLVTLQSCTST